MSALLEQMEEKHQKSYKWNKGGLTRTVTYVKGERSVIDEKGLRKALTAKVYDKFTEKKLIRRKLEEAMNNGEVDPMVVAQHVTTTPTAGYLRYTEHNEEEL